VLYDFVFYPTFWDVLVALMDEIFLIRIIYQTMCKAHGSCIVESLESESKMESSFGMALSCCFLEPRPHLRKVRMA
jgi:hypothetical protein